MRKLIKTEEGYEFRVDGERVIHGPLSWVKAYLKKRGIDPREIDLAAETMEKHHHNEADFGIAGSFIFSTTRDEALEGHNYTQEAQ